MKIVIIEDELLTADDLAKCIVAADPMAEITAILPSVKEAVSYFEENAGPDLIFSDIQLGDGISFEIFEKLTSAIPVIFCTAYDEYALNAFKAAGIDYILKPFTLKTISAALVKYNELRDRFSKSPSPNESIAAVMANIKKQKQLSILVHYKEKILPVPVDDIAVLYLQNETTHMATFSKQQYIIYKTLDEMEKNMPAEFYRANRQYIVNRKAIKDISHYFARKLLINLTIPFEDKITVSKAKANHFLLWLAGS